MIKAVIIDDEQTMLQTNSLLLSEYFPEIALVGTAVSIKNGIDLIREQKPDLVLLDIELTDGTGFQLLQQLHPYDFKVVFITGYDSFAIKAMKYSAIDYIMKPVNESEFQVSIQRAVELILKNENAQPQTNVLLDAIGNESKNRKLVLRTSDSLHVISIADIYYCKSDNSYTTFYFKGNDEILVSKSLKDYESILTAHGFFRPHQSFLVNLNHIRKVDKSDGGFIIMQNGKEIPVSLRQMKTLVTLLEQL